jgi:hypothetical protein
MELVRYYRWALNFWIAGVPYFLLLTLLNGWNIYFNINLNHMWAGMNVFLLFNTAFSLVQSFLSMWLVFEVPTWLHYAKMIRVYSLYYAVIWNFIFFLYLRKAYSIISHADEEEFTTMDFFTLFFLGYNIWLHGPIFLINSIIIFKEVLFEMI